RPPSHISDSDEDYELIDQSVSDRSNDVVDLQKDFLTDAEAHDNADNFREEPHPETISTAAQINEIENSLDQSEETENRRGNEEVTPQEEEEEVAAPRRNEGIRMWDCFILASLLSLVILDLYADQRVIEREKNLTQTYEQRIQKHEMDLEGMKRRVWEMQRENFTTAVELAAKEDAIDYLKEEMIKMMEKDIKLEQNYDEKIRHSNNVIRELNRDIEIKTTIS
ncbi:hypothetical protein PRIPAC_93565, partial [Pristionchus pacificus]